MLLGERVIAWLAHQDTISYLVGGCVRDRLLNRPVRDLDVATEGDGLILARRLADDLGGAYYPLDEERSTGRAILVDGGGERLVVDVARLRGPGLAADLADRDFTVNALAANVRTPDDIIDQHNGLGDLKAGVIHPVSETSIRNDPLRALRAIRLAGELDFSISEQTEDLIRRDGLALSQVAGERVRDELARVLVLSNAAHHLNRLDDLGLLVAILPELEPLRGLAQPPPHYLNALAHSVQTVQALEEMLCILDRGGGKRCGCGKGTEREMRGMPFSVLEPFGERLSIHLSQPMSESRPRLVTVKLATLLHDTGKSATRAVEEGGRIRFIDHHSAGAKITGRVLRRLRFNKSEVRLGEIMVSHHMRPLLLASQKSVSGRAVFRFFRDTGEAGVDIILHALADCQATCASGAEDERWLRLVALAVRMLGDWWERREERVDPPLLVDGYDLLREFGLQPGPLIGELLDAVREAQVSGEVRTRLEALALVRSRLGLPQ